MGKNWIEDKVEVLWGYLPQGPERKIAPQALPRVAPEIPGELRAVLRAGRSYGDALAEEKITYAAGAMGIRTKDGDFKGTEKEVSKKVIRRTKELKLMVRGGTIKDAETIEAVGALAEYVEKRLKKKEWKALTITLNEPNIGLRIAPDLARALITTRDPERAMQRYKKERDETIAAMPYEFRANVISYFKKGFAKKGPEHVVPIVETEMDWSTGKAKGKYLFYMLRYETDISVDGIGGLVMNATLSPYPEYEPFGGSFTVGNDGKLKLKEFMGRTHWVPWRMPIKSNGKALVELTDEGAIKVTAREDGKRITYGHISLPVVSDFDAAWKEIMERNEELHRLVHLHQDTYLYTSLKQAPIWYEQGEKYEIPVRTTMLSTRKKSDPFYKALRS